MLASLVLSGCSVLDNLFHRNSSSSSVSSLEPEPEPEPKVPDEIVPKSKKSVSTHLYTGYNLKALSVYFSQQTVDIPFVAFGTFYNNLYCGLYSDNTLKKKSSGYGLTSIPDKERIAPAI